ncbi:hypothetical protein J6590_037607 [Homalodisca vitripennis]|nr:hypothetical protein J6590_037607 [Homalodisca vitripennis]
MSDRDFPLVILKPEFAVVVEKRIPRIIATREALRWGMPCKWSQELSLSSLSTCMPKPQRNDGEHGCTERLQQHHGNMPELKTGTQKVNL